jgi:predicted TIM-barrel fold metal-dependent hydrolase
VARGVVGAIGRMTIAPTPSPRGEFSIIDAHVHLVRDTAQEQRVFPKPGAPEGWLWASPDAIGPFLERMGMSHVVALNVINTRAMTRRQLEKGGLRPDSPGAAERVADLRLEMQARVREFNDWICATHRADQRVVPCIYLDPVLFGVDGAVAEFERTAAAGAKGVKMHPDISGFTPEDRRHWPLFERLQALDLPVVFDTGANVLGEGDDNGRPARFADLLGAFPRLRVVLAHFASAYWDERVALAERFPNVYFDTAGGFNTPERAARGGIRSLAEVDAVRVLRQVGLQRVMFGSDAPGSDVSWQAFQAVRLPLTSVERRALLAGTARAVFGLT